MKKSIYFFAVLIFLGMTYITTEVVVAQGLSFGTSPRRLVLENGMTLVSKRVYGTPIVSIQAFIRAGLKSEGEYLGTGISHLIEHMLFKGTKRRGPGEIACQIKELGGEIRGYTGPDYTCLHITVRKSGFPLAIEVLSDVLMNSVFDKEELEREMEVIRREFAMNEDDPGKVLSRALWQNAYSVHYYKHPVIGYRSLFEELKREDCLKYYRRMYVPGNIVLSVVGDLEWEAIVLHVKKAFRDFKRRPNPLPFVPAEPKQQGERRFVIRRDVKQSRILFGYHTCSIDSKDVFPLDVLAILLGQGQGSRLYRVLKEKQGIVHSISCWSWTPEDPGLFGISALVDDDKVDEVCSEIKSEIEKIRNGFLEEEELARAKRSVLSDYIFSLQTVESQARNLGVDELICKDMNYSKRYVKEIENVQVDDIVRVARLYLGTENLTLGILRPSTKKEDSTIIESGVKEGEVGIERTRLTNGVTLLVKEDHSLPIVSVRCVFRGGVRVETKETNGLCNFLARTLLRGTKRRKWSEIVPAVEDRGGSLSTYCGRNSFGIKAECLSDDLPFVLDVISDCVANSSFPDEEIEKVRKEIMAEIKENEDDVFYLASGLFQKALFIDHPYRFQVLGEKEVISSISREDILGLYKRLVSPQNLVLAIFGDVDHEEVKDVVVQKFGGLFGEGGGIPDTLPQRSLSQRRVIEIEKDREQTVIFLGFRGVSVRDNDRYVLEVISSALSSQGGRFFETLRGKDSLAYCLGASFFLGLDPGGFYFYISTSKEKASSAIQGILKEVQTLQSHLLSKEELDRVKNHLIGDFLSRHQTNGSQAFQAALDELYGLGYNRSAEYEREIMAVTPQRIREVARRYFDTEIYAMGIVWSKR